MPSLGERLSQATIALLGRENRNVLMSMESPYGDLGLPPAFDPHKALSGYDCNLWLGGAVDRIAREIARKKCHLQTENTDGEIEIIKDHESLMTLKKPQLTNDGKCLWSDTPMQSGHAADLT